MSYYYEALPRDNLENMFPLKPKLCEDTRGMSLGKILKFETFYLKIYPDQTNANYVVQGFIYGKVNPVFIDRVNGNMMRKYAEQFTTEDSLSGMLARHGMRAIDNGGG